MSSLPLFLTEITSGRLFNTVELYCNHSDPVFKELAARWSDLDLKTPRCIIIPKVEQDIASIVKLAVKLGVPFVSKAGGHSLWSTIGDDGFILDLSRFRHISINVERRQVTVGAGVLTKEANDAAFQRVLVLPLGASNSIGVVPFSLGGGRSYFENHCGFGADNIVSARLVTTKGDLIDVSAISNPDLFWALRGAGQMFGVVTELTLQAYPISILGSEDGTLWRSSMMYSRDKAALVLEALDPTIKTTSAPARGMLFAVAPAPSYNTSIVLSLMYFGPTAAAEKHFSVLLHDLSPILVRSEVISVNKLNDGSAALNANEGFKRFASAGFQNFEPAPFLALIERFEELRITCPDCRSSAYALAWNTYISPSDPKGNTLHIAYSQHDINVWAQLLSNYNDPQFHSEVTRIEQATLEDIRQAYGQEESDKAAYANFTREEPISRIYRGKERIRTLEKLKREWDPQGVFSSMFL